LRVVIGRDGQSGGKGERGKRRKGKTKIKCPRLLL